MAVLSVVLFHLEPRWLPGGFVGVDVFFVISGFLITGIIARQVQNGSFSFFEFYRRRIKRIVPVLTTVILVTLLVGQLLLLPEDLERLSVSALASQFFVGNVYFTYFLDTSYFAPDASLEPLLHVWSLGVEEQFYLLWPVTLVWLLSWRARSRLILVVSLAAGLSFILPALMPSADPMFVYYMLPARAGELLAGALCFFATRAVPRPSAGWVRLCAYLGASMIVLSLAFLSSAQLFPGLRGIPVSLGTAMLIFAGTGENWISRLLSVRILVWIGLISYSMYLWHWPVLAYVRYLFGDVAPVGELLAFVGIVVLSYLSYRFVEKPFRASNRPFRRIFIRHFLYPSAAVAAVATAFIVTSGFGLYGLSSEYASNLENLDNSHESLPGGKRICREYELTEAYITDPTCIVNGEEEPRVLLWGDSKAAHYVGALAVLAETYGFSFRSLAHLACPPLFRDAEDFTSERFRHGCSVSSRLVRNVPGTYHTVIISADWGGYLYEGGHRFAEALEETVAELVGVGTQVIVLGVVTRVDSFDRDCDRKAIKAPFLNCRERSVVSRDEVDQTNDRIKQIAEANGAVYLDFNDQLCSDGMCSAYLGEQALYHSHGHLSSAGSATIGRMLIGSNEANTLVALLGPKRSYSN